MIPSQSTDLVTRRQLLAAGACATAATMLASRRTRAADAPTTQPSGPTANGSTDPFPIPWLDKNGSHNQPAGPGLEASHIFHVSGRAARCAGFTGIGTDSDGHRVPFGTATTDYGFMDGTYWAARQPQRGVFTHI